MTRDGPLTLSQLPAGRSARVVSVLPGPRRVRLASLGLVVGARVELAQRKPALVARVGETTLALEAEIGDEILVQLEDRR
jgi:Fe2+ transport system protein FeoA